MNKNTNEIELDLLLSMYCCLRINRPMTCCSRTHSHRIFLVIAVVLLDTTTEEKLDWTRYPFGPQANTPGVSTPKFSSHVVEGIELFLKMFAKKLFLLFDTKENYLFPIAANPRLFDKKRRESDSKIRFAPSRWKDETIS